jgi:hypothetical protein
LTPDALAKSAREKLALALNALQTSPDTPVDLLDLAEPIAQTMGILHRIERSQGKDLSGRDQVLANIRGALNSLQTMTESHPAIDAVMEQVAGCLASAHQLARYEAPAPAAAPAGLAPVVPTAPGGVASVTANIPPPQPTPQPVVHAPNPFTQPAQVVPAAPHVPSAPIIPQSAPVVSPPPGFAAPPPVANMQQTMPLTPPAPSPPPGQGPSNTVRMQGDAVPEIAQAKALAAQQAHIAQQQAALHQAHQQSAQQQALEQQHAAQQALQAKQAPAQAFQAAVSPQSSTQSRPAPAAAGQSGNVIVELGTHSISNFYKGLGGNDVIEAGGIFVGTYKIPKLGAQVNLRVCLPGDYEFQATGTVQWIREPSHSGEGSEPGFGARFTQITPEGRQLVYRYTRNREPMFYDDL